MLALGPTFTALEGQLRQRVQQVGLVSWLDRNGCSSRVSRPRRWGAGPRPGWRRGGGCMTAMPPHGWLSGFSRRLSAQSGPELAEYFHLEGRRHAR